MTGKKQITIYELLPLLNPGWVAMDKNKRWVWYGYKPVIYQDRFVSTEYVFPIPTVLDKDLFNIAPFDGDWEDSLMEVK